MSWKITPKGAVQLMGSTSISAKIGIEPVKKHLGNNYVGNTYVGNT